MDFFVFVPIAENKLPFQYYDFIMIKKKNIIAEKKVQISFDYNSLRRAETSLSRSLKQPSDVIFASTSVSIFSAEGITLVYLNKNILNL